MRKQIAFHLKKSCDIRWFCVKSFMKLFINKSSNVSLKGLSQLIVIRSAGNDKYNIAYAIDKNSKTDRDAKAFHGHRQVAQCVCVCV